MTLDTNILIAYINGDAKAIETLSVWKEEGKTLFISSVSRAELLSLSELTALEINKTKKREPVRPRLFQFQTMGGRSCLASAAGGKLHPTLSESSAGEDERV